MSRLFGFGPCWTRRSGWLLGVWLAACGAATEPTWHEPARKIVPRDVRGSGSDAHGTGAGSSESDPAGGESHSPAGSAGDPTAVIPPGAVDTDDQSDPSSDDSSPTSDDEGSGIGDDVLVPNRPDDELLPDDETSGEQTSGEDDEPMQAICATEPLWVSGDIAASPDIATSTSWLVPASDSSAIGWTLLSDRPIPQRFQFGTGNLEMFPDSQVEHECATFTPPWTDLVSTHAISTELLGRVLPCPSESVIPSGALSGGAVALTPDGSRLLKVRCDADHTELQVFALGTTNELTATYALSGTACPTRMLATDEFALIADNAPALRYIDLLDGSELFNLTLPGPAGQIDATENADRVLLSTLRSDLIDLQPGRFMADALVVSVPVSTLRDTPGQNMASSRLSFVSGGALVSDEASSPGYIQLPGALHPAGTLTATFGPDEDLVVLDTETSTAVVLEPGSVPDELLEQEPRSAGLPTALEFSADGQFLARVRGGQLAVFACTQQPRR